MSHLHNLFMGIRRICNLIFNFFYGRVILLNVVYVVDVSWFVKRFMQVILNADIVHGVNYESNLSESNYVITATL